MSRFSGIFGLCLVLFGLLAYLVHRYPILPGDTTISLWLQGVDLPYFNPMMAAISYIASTIPAIGIVALVSGALWIAHKRVETILIILLTSSTALLDWLLKLLISRPFSGTEFIQTLGVNNSHSFPSGHTAYAVVFYGFLFYLVPRLTKQPAMIWLLRTLLILLILLTGVSRVYLRAHWPSDVLGGLFLGGLLLAPAIVLHNSYAQGHRIKLVYKNARTT